MPSLANDLHHINDLNKAIESLDNTLFRESLNDVDISSDNNGCESDNTVSKGMRSKNNDLS